MQSPRLKRIDEKQFLRAACRFNHVYIAVRYPTSFSLARSAEIGEAATRHCLTILVVILKYRRDIDGLRAIAVVPVVLYHAGLGIFPGGYVGVDIFFVISGFLITRIICDEIAAGRFSYSNFYERRIRRIAPAFFAVCLFTLVVATAIFLPSDLKSLSSSLIAAISFVSNIYFYRTSGYFSDDAELMPMLHTWSLSVEEQFYIVMPIVLALVFRWRFNLRWIMVAGLAGSLALSAFTIRDYGAATFYLLPTRAWELLAGSLLAVGGFNIPGARNRLLNEIVAAIGMALIGYAIFFYKKDTIFPGPTAIAPVLGAALLIATGKADTIVSRILSLRPFVAIGLVSYSLYLWHWPLIVFANYYLITPMTIVQGCAIVALSLAASYLSWRFIELPFRRPPESSAFSGVRTLFGTAAGAAAILIAAAAVISGNSGFPGRVDERVMALANSAKDFSPYRSKCHSDNDHIVSPENACRFPEGGAAGRSLVAVMGDSHAVELSYDLSEQFRNNGMGVLQLSASSCPPILDVDVVGRSVCRRENQQRVSYVVGNPAITAVVLVGFHESHVRTIGFEPYMQGLEKTVAVLRQANKEVVIEGPIPVPYVALAQSYARAELFGRPFAPSLSAQKFKAETAAIDERLQAIATRHGAVFDRPADTLCASGTCLFMADGKPLYFDAFHLGMTGVRILTPHLARNVMAANGLALSPKP